MAKLSSNSKITNQIRQLKSINIQRVKVRCSEVKPIVVPSQYKQSTGSIATRRLSFFFRKGKQSGRESIFRNFVINRANSFVQKKIQYKTSFFFKSFFNIATPFVGLKTRRRRKRIVYKVVLLERDRGVRKALGALSSIFQSQGFVSKPFEDRLKGELESIADTYIKGRAKPYRNKLSGRMGKQKHKQKQAIASNSVQSQNAISSIREKRDEMHRLALQAAPYRWTKNRRWKRKSTQNKQVKSRYLMRKRTRRFRIKSITVKKLNNLE